MGGYQSRDKENIVIAQTNSSKVEQQISQFGIALGTVLVLILIIILYFVYNRCVSRTRKWISGQMTDMYASIRRRRPASDHHPAQMSHVVVE